MNTAPREVIERVLREEDLPPEGLQPSILMNLNIDHSRVTAYTTCHVNDSWAEKLEALIADGWTVFRIQTEFGLAGHYTMAYFAKMKE